MALATCQEIHQEERMTPDLYRGTLGRRLGSHNENVPASEWCDAGCNWPHEKESLVDMSHVFKGDCKTAPMRRF